MFRPCSVQSKHDGLGTGVGLSMNVMDVTCALLKLLVRHTSIQQDFTKEGRPPVLSDTTLNSHVKDSVFVLCEYSTNDVGECRANCVVCSTWGKSHHLCPIVLVIFIMMNSSL